MLTISACGTAADVTDGDVATVEGQTAALSTADGVTVNGQYRSFQLFDRGGIFYLGLPTRIN